MISTESKDISKDISLTVQLSLGQSESLSLSYGVFLWSRVCVCFLSSAGLDVVCVSVAVLAFSRRSSGLQRRDRIAHPMHFNLSRETSRSRHPACRAHLPRV